MTDILDLPGWRVISSEISDQAYTITAEYTEPLEACTKCGTIGNLYRHGTKPVIYRDSPIRGCHVQIKAVVQRYRCKDCGGTSLQQLTGIDTERRMTVRCLDYIRTQCLRDTFTRIAEHVGCDEKTIRNVAQWLITRFNDEYVPAVPEWLGIDETKLSGDMRGILTDVVNRKPVDILPARDSRSLAQWIVQHKAAGIVKGVATDMHRPYHKVVADLLPGVPVVVDKFHVVRAAGNGLDKARIRLGKAAGRRVNLGWKRSKTLLNKSYKKLNDQQRFNLDMWLDNEPELAIAYRLKEDFYAIYDLPKDEANQALDKWIERAKASPVKSDFKELLSFLKNWRSAIMAYFDYPVTNGYTEALNGVAKVINRQGRGYTFDVIRMRVLAPHERKKAQPAPSLYDVKTRLVEQSGGQCASCLGLFDSDELELHHDSEADLEAMNFHVVCMACNRRLHTMPLNQGIDLNG